MNIRKILCLFGHKWERIGEYCDESVAGAAAHCFRCRSNENATVVNSGSWYQSKQRAREALSLKLKGNIHE